MKPIYVALIGVGAVGLFLFSVRRAATLSKPLSSTTPKKPGSRPATPSSSSSSLSTSSSREVGGASGTPTQVEQDKPRRAFLFPVGTVVNAQLESGTERVKIISNEPSIDEEGDVKDYIVIGVNCFLPDDFCPSMQINQSDIT